MYSRRPRTSSRRYGKSKEEFSEDRDEEWPEKSRQKKRKISDLLGPPWSEEDLKHFYQSYRRHGRDWKKVAGSFQNRTVEMIEVLYKMNKAYLSLPEGAASSAGLIAMMTDHYNILEESKSNDDDESSKEIAGSGPSNQISSRSRRNTSAAIQPGNNSKLSPQVSVGMLNYAVPSPAKKPRTIAANRPRAVGKRTPRVPWTMMQTVDKKPMDNDADQDSYGECDEMKVALTLAASASQRAVSPQISRTPGSRTDRLRNSPTRTQNGHTKHILTAESESSATRHTGSNIEDGEDGASEESKDTDNGVVTKSINSIAGARRRVLDVREASDGLRRTPNAQSRKGKVQGLQSFRSYDLKEECSCTEEETMKKDDVKGEQQSKKKRPPSSQKTKKRSRQLFTGDERSGLDALATLADLSLNGLLPSPRNDSGAVKNWEMNKDTRSVTVTCSEREDLVAHLEAFCGSSKEMPNMVNAKGGLVGRSKDFFSKIDSGSNFEMEFQTASELKKKKKTLVPDKRDLFQNVNGEHDNKVSNMHSEEPVARMKAKRTFPVQTLSKYTGRPIKKETEQEPETQEVILGGSEAEHSNIVKLPPLKKRSRRKTKLKESARTVIPHFLHATENNSSDNIKLMHCLSSEKVRKWCIYEWFYSAIDLPWFARNEFVEYLNHAGLGHVPRLTRAEWGVIRGSLGKPRRLSKRFLHEEREKLEYYRDSVRRHYQDVRTGDSVPPDLPRNLVVGQRVIARHPKEKELCKGSILTVDLKKFRVQFDRPEMGVELVADIDCMPINGLENLSNTSVQKSIQADVGNRNIKGSECDVQLWATGTAAALAAPSSLNNKLDQPEGVPGSHSATSLLNALCKQAQAANTVDSVIQVKVAANEAVAAAQRAMYHQPCSLAQVQAREADIRALADLTRALDKKEAILLELRNMNDDADSNQRHTDNLSRSDIFKKHYATLLLQLKEVNKQVCGALLHLRQRNKYQDNCIPPWQCSSLQQTMEGMDPGGLETNSLSLDLSPLVKEVMLNAKEQANLMVNTAMDTMFSIKPGEDVLSKIGMALNQLTKTNLSSSSYADGKADDISPPLGTGKDNDSVFLSDLMSNCVATLLMVQAFTERQFPPAEIAMAFDSILASMRPRCSQNYPIYSEIQQYANHLKSQIIALIPTQSLPVDFSLLQ